MQVEIHGKPSFSKKGARAQVVVLVGEGRNRRSVTRHVERRGYSWVGLNPDERAIPLNERYEHELTGTQHQLGQEEEELDVLKRRLEALETEEKEVASLYDAAALDVERDKLVEAITMARAKAAFAALVLADAEVKLTIVQREVPLEVEFYGDELDEQL